MCDFIFLSFLRRKKNLSPHSGRLYQIEIYINEYASVKEHMANTKDKLRLNKCWGTRHECHFKDKNKIIEGTRRMVLCLLLLYSIGFLIESNVTPLRNDERSQTCVKGMMKFWVVWLPNEILVLIEAIIYTTGFLPESKFRFSIVPRLHHY